jgi:hypothetical protein
MTRGTKTSIPDLGSEWSYCTADFTDLAPPPTIRWNVSLRLYPLNYSGKLAMMIPREHRAVFSFSFSNRHGWLNASIGIVQLLPIVVMLI